MGIHWESYAATDMGTDWHLPLEEVDSYGTIDAGQYGISFGSGDGVMVTGTPEELLTWAEYVLEQAKKIEAHAAEPLGHQDFISDEDGSYPCPRCGDTFEPRDYDDLRELLRMIDAHCEGHNGAA